jgi:hypothetical protein
MMQAGRSPMSKMTYIRIRWLHAFPDSPVDYWSELDCERFETRKLEYYRDGTVGYASAVEAVGDTVLGVLTVPLLHEIASNPEFEPEEITKADFEQKWEIRHLSSR